MVALKRKSGLRLTKVIIIITAFAMKYVFYIHLIRINAYKIMRIVGIIYESHANIYCFVVLGSYTCIELPFIYSYYILSICFEDIKAL